jgi:signal transduction histidine kinase
VSTGESPRITAARERAVERERRRARIVRPLALIVFAIEALPALAASPRPRLAGAGLPVALALAISLLALVALVGPRPRPRVEPVDEPGRARRRLLALLVILAAGGESLDALQHDNTAVLGLTLVIWIAAASLPLAGAITLSVLAAAPALLTILLVDASPAVPFVFTVLLCGLMFMLAHNGRRAREELARNELLVAELADMTDAVADSAALAERGRIAREMHDVLAHTLSGLALQLETATLLVRREQASVRLQGTLGRATELAHDGLDEARHAIEALRDGHIPGPEALPELIEHFGRDANIDVTLTVDGDRRRLPAEAALTVYRVTQEALTNVARHSHARSARVRLCYEREATRLVISDHRGAAPNGDELPAPPPRLAAVGAGYGLSAMRERAALLDGTVTARTTDDGFRVELTLPATG